MNRLTDCPSCTRPARIIDPKTKMSLTVTSPRPLVAFELDDDVAWGGTTTRPDGVLVGETDVSTLVCFVELKGRTDGDPDKPFRQIEAAVEHFAPIGRAGGVRGHGDDHHDAFTAGDDLPTHTTGQRPKAIPIDRDHVVRGVILVRRMGTRIEPRWVEHAGKQVFIAAVQIHGRDAQATIALPDLAAQLGLASSE